LPYFSIIPTNTFPLQKAYCVYESAMFSSCNDMLAPKGVYDNDIKILLQQLREEKYRAAASKKANAYTSPTLSRM
jgi:hypothetical protein